MTSDPFDLSDWASDAPPPAPTPLNVPQAGGEPAYLKGLNPPQRDAVLTTDGPLLVLAGAGTGKTRVLTTRLGHLMADGLAAPWNILAVTFTNKAAREMQDRVARVIGAPTEGMWIGTFHSICVRILRRHAELVGLQSNFSILDTDDQIRLLKQLTSAENIDDKRWPARQLAALIDRWKNKALTPDRVPNGEAQAYANGLGAKLYRAYQDRLKTLNACDFGDLMMHVISIFQAYPDILNRYHAQFRYIMVDEYQDTNVAQYLWLRLLARGHNNICCVGDDDQSIYGWRGAEVGNILRFSEDFPGAKIVRLEQNYRSTGHILAAASSLIASNEGRLGKTLWTDAGDGESVRVRGVWDAPEEARTIGDEIEALQVKGEPLKEIAVLVRAGFQTREFEERFITLGLPYRVIGGPRFYERAEIRDAMAYLRVIAQENDDLAFERIVNLPKRGLGETSLQKVHALARERGLPLTKAARIICGMPDGLRPAARTTLTRLLDDFDRWRDMIVRHDATGITPHSHTELAEIVLEESGYTEMWQKDKSPEAPGRLENLKELVSAMGDFENLGGFLEHISLVMENSNNDSADKITVMTLHAAKGLEFDNVFLPGWEEGIFPSQRTLDESGVKGLEEERRLAYVGLTRARQRAWVFYAANRQVFGQWQTSLPSRFVEELPEQHTEVEAAQGLYRSRYERTGGWNSDWTFNEPAEQKGTGYGPGWQRAREWRQSQTASDKPVVRKIAGARAGGATVRASQKSETKTVSDFAVGERVFHEKFGYGTVEDVEGNKLLVDFEKAGAKRVMDNFVSRA